jgi:SAM-dependent methyltransferase
LSFVDTVRRFDDRVDDYARWRPGYPAQVAAVLHAAGLPRRATLADVGSGTGKLAATLLDAGHRVLGVEPGDAMRAAAQRALGEHPRWRQVAGRAEATGLSAGCVDAVVAGQAFHWFEPDATRAEFLRILRPDGLVALVWNDRNLQDCPLLAEYERLLVAHAPGYAALERRGDGDDGVRAFFSPAEPRVSSLPNVQRLLWDGLVGRARSASYLPLAGPGHDAFFAGLRAAFERHARDGAVDLLHDTRVYVGRLLPR